MGAALAIIGLIVQMAPIIVQGYKLLAGNPTSPKAESIFDSVLATLELTGQAITLLKQAQSEGRDVTKAELDAITAQSRALFAEVDAELTAAISAP
jgi:hypothetical protein